MNNGSLSFIWGGARTHTPNLNLKRLGVGSRNTRMPTKIRTPANFDTRIPLVGGYTDLNLIGRGGSIVLQLLFYMTMCKYYLRCRGGGGGGGGRELDQFIVLQPLFSMTSSYV